MKTYQRCFYSLLIFTVCINLNIRTAKAADTFPKALTQLIPSGFTIDEKRSVTLAGSPYDTTTITAVKANKLPERIDGPEKAEFKITYMELSKFYRENSMLQTLVTDKTYENMKADLKKKAKGKEESHAGDMICFYQDISIENTGDGEGSGMIDESKLNKVTYYGADFLRQIDDHNILKIEIKGYVGDRQTMQNWITKISSEKTKLENKTVDTYQEYLKQFVPPGFTVNEDTMSSAGLGGEGTAIVLASKVNKLPGGCTAPEEANCEITYTEYKNSANANLLWEQQKQLFDMDENGKKEIHNGNTIYFYKGTLTNEDDEELCEDSNDTVTYYDIKLLKQTDDHNVIKIKISEFVGDPETIRSWLKKISSEKTKKE